MTQPILSLQELSKYYVNGQSVVAGLNKINLQFDRGEFVAITGESGSGKSSLVQILGGILPYEDGELWIDGKPTSHYGSTDWERYRAESVGFISQQYGILPGATVQENVISALRLTGMEKAEATVESQRILEEVELWPMRARRAAKLSSGQKQRLSIARALAKPCSILIADEPTGNLDPENSDKVIRLLAQAAQDRLVILVTHEFSEAEHYVTRHITLQDGRVCADARLRPCPPQDFPAPKSRPVKDLSTYVAGLQLRSRPVWSCVLLLFTVLTAFSVFAFLGSFIVAADDTSTRIYESTAFLNGDKTRIVVVREDLANMTQADYDRILSTSHVTSLEVFGYIADIQYFFQEGADYRLNYTQHNYGTIRNPRYMELPTPEFYDVDQFMQTIPQTRKNSQFLTAGELPDNFYEVVAVGDADLIGQTVTVYLCRGTDWEDGGYIRLEMTIVGVTNTGKGLYFHEDLARTLTLHYMGAAYAYMPWYGQVPSSATYTNYRNARSKAMYGEYCNPFHVVCNAAPSATMRDMADTEVYVTLNSYISVLEQNPTAAYREIYQTPFVTETGTWHVAGVLDSTLHNLLAVNPSRFAQILADSGVENGNQVSIHISDYAYTQRVINSLEKAGYYALSPYVLGATHIDAELAAQRTQTLAVCAGALVVILLLQMIVLPSLFATQTESYRTLSDMGLTYRTAGRSIFAQVMIIAVAGQLLALAAIGICALAGVSQIADLTKYLYGRWWVLISVIHLASIALAAWLVRRNLKKRVYPRSAVTRDLILDEEEEMAT